jgi:hypothetical protein
MQDSSNKNTKNTKGGRIKRIARAIGWSIAGMPTGALGGLAAGHVIGLVKYPIPDVRYQEPEETPDAAVRRQIETDPNPSHTYSLAEAAARIDEMKAHEIAERVSKKREAEEAPERKAASDAVRGTIEETVKIGAVLGALSVPALTAVDALKRRKRKAEDMIESEPDQQAPSL